MGASIVGGASWLHDLGMTPTTSVRLTLELERSADPVRGSIEHPDGTRRPFWGWLQLIEEVRRVAEGPPKPSDPSSTNGRDITPTENTRS